jgi:hypothetical protein
MVEVAQYDTLKKYRNTEFSYILARDSNIEQRDRALRVTIIIATLKVDGSLVRMGTATRHLPNPVCRQLHSHL